MAIYWIVVFVYDKWKNIWLKYGYIGSKKVFIIVRTNKKIIYFKIHTIMEIEKDIGNIGDIWYN